MDKIIIHNLTDKPMDEVLVYVRLVVSNGRVSGDGKAYCYLTTWRDGTVVYSKRNGISDTFTVSETSKEV